MHIGIIVAIVALGVSGSALAAAADPQVDTKTAPIAKAPPVACDAPPTVDHAINTKGTGAQDARMAINTKGTGCNNGKMANNKHPDLMKRTQ